jgi:hypothetical protein
MIPIDKDIKMPGSRHGFPFDGMQVGDSFLVPPKISRAVVSAAMQRAAEKLKAKFSLRAVGNGDVRCWRIE